MANTWRQMTVKVLDLGDTPAGTNAAEESVGVVPLAQVKDSYYRQLAENFRGDACFLLKSLEETDSADRSTELIRIIRAIGRVAGILWSQKARTISSKHDIRNECLFDRDSRTIQAHSCMVLEEGDRQYDGRRVELIIEPAVYAAGNEDGQNYDQLKVRLPAIGWLPKERTEWTPLSSTAMDQIGSTNDDATNQQERPAKRAKYQEVFQALLEAPPQTESVNLDAEEPGKMVLSEGPDDVGTAPSTYYTADTAVENYSSECSNDSSFSIFDEDHAISLKVTRSNLERSHTEEAETFGKGRTASSTQQYEGHQDRQSRSLQDSRSTIRSSDSCGSVGDNQEEAKNTDII